MLASNLNRADYVAILCGTMDDLPAAFADLDAHDRSMSLPARLRAAPCADSDIVSASLPRADRLIVRAEPLSQRVLAEAASRAPRIYAACP
jgi:hypothetical protein